ncbi:MAG TPA: hypothetical protein PKY82_27635 [Pyrinomonadaceae bacterium]|nr:hypothetical protein [Pyrinomonadaceae bacterium]
MKKITFLAIIGLIGVGGLTGACSSGSTTTSTTNTTNNQAKQTNTNAANTANTTTTAKTEEDAPASVKAVFPDAQSFTKQHKDIPKDVIADIEKDTGGKVPDTDHHSYLAFSTTGGARKQIGAATLVKAGGKEMVVVYDSKDGSPIIKEIRADGISAEFLKQFAGKTHDDKFAVGGDIKANGVDDATAKAIAKAVQIDFLTMQHLYGAAHTH